MPPLGQTGLEVSRIGLGLAALGRPGYINLGHADDLHGDYDVSAMRERAFAVLDAARDLGIRYFDAARSYGRAEEFLGAWLRARNDKQDGFVVGSKWGYTYTADWCVTAEHHEIKDHSLPVLDRQIRESRQHLGHHLNLYQIHSATLESGVLDKADVMSALAKLREEGVRVGLSVSGPRQGETILRALEVRVDGVLLFDCVQATWNLLHRSAGTALQAAHERGLGVIVKEALANGRLTSRNQDKRFEESRDRLEKTAARLETTTDALALAAVLAQPWASVVLSGAATVEQLRSNLSALQVRWDEQGSTELASLEEAPATYWATRGGLAWN
jgi:aryl-alcohol dehydrogenase-like predicted oxidoreductase